MKRNTKHGSTWVSKGNLKMLETLLQNVTIKKEKRNGIMGIKKERKAIISPFRDDMVAVKNKMI
jgi:predicted site-specific integrase-resolvase